MSVVLRAGTVLVRLTDIPDGGARVIDLNGEEFPPLTGLVARIGDAVHVYLNRCPHAGRPLGFGSVVPLTPDGELLQCHAHGALFEKHSGVCVAGPCLDDALRRVPAAVIDGEVRLSEELDTAALARTPW
jgi:nitrite reductase/ring-hydroxylating ferredoxin subunit